MATIAIKVLSERDEEEERDYLWYCPVHKVFHQGYKGVKPVCPDEKEEQVDGSVQ